MSLSGHKPEENHVWDLIGSFLSGEKTIIMDQFATLLNAVLKANLSKINTEIDAQISNHGMDPMVSVVSGSASPGSIDLGICTATASANYGLTNLQGLSSFNMTTLEITAANATNNGSNLIGSIAMSASLNSTIRIDLGGNLKAGCGFLSGSVGLSGSIAITGVTMRGVGDFHASISDKICLNDLHLGQINLDYSDVSVHVDGLGIFDGLLSGIAGIINDVVKGPVISLVGGAIGNPINSAINRLLPQCASL